MQKIIRYEIAEDREYEYLLIETWGDLKYMPRSAQTVYAAFGMFERTKDSTLRYTASIGRDKNREIDHYPDSEYLDDYHMLKDGNIEIVD